VRSLLEPPAAASQARALSSACHTAARRTPPHPPPPTITPHPTAPHIRAPPRRRLSDHEPLHAACQAQPDLLLPVFCLDPRELAPRSYGGDHGPDPALAPVPRLGPHRLRFLLECAAALQRRLRALRSDLLFAVARPEELLPLLARRLAAADGARAVRLYHQQEPLPEAAELEDEVLRRLQAAAASAGAAACCESAWGLTLYHPDDLPYGPGPASAAPGGGRRAFADRPNRDAARYSRLPGVMTDFRRSVLAGAQVGAQASAQAGRVLPAPSAGLSAGSAERGIRHHGIRHQEWPLPALCPAGAAVPARPGLAAAAAGGHAGRGAGRGWRRTVVRQHHRAARRAPRVPAGRRRGAPAEPGAADRLQLRRPASCWRR
jgi:deoxyribodipyrimidine photo-lyase